MHHSFSVILQLIGSLPVVSLHDVLSRQTYLFLILRKNTGSVHLVRALRFVNTFFGFDSIIRVLSFSFIFEIVFSEEVLMLRHARINMIEYSIIRECSLLD